ncbi:LPXTG-motif cell wall anchor domain-containing protein [Clostridium amylolyticum]|uniref:LPXTG-motif cell wall anchor domain-containing protein n=1 Tax=Clostridium amylolyticum TaxID=1121298 RepID=A0A1M6C4Y6_9CLOT|nr:CehA/McbA family metallohydrolase [Clostridium amylolyticum]SHI56003.1 LPXTG-motif cell wall anchor domain-containing protein [Clostridium amylolyticum]
MRSKKNLKSISLMTAMVMLFSIFSGFVRVGANEINTNFAEDLIISEYVEGSGNNKALELYNGTGKTLDLAAYTVEVYMNGATSKPNIIRFQTSTLLEDGKTYVIANNQANDIVKGKAQQLDGYINFNGDDVVVLKKGDNVVDSFGKVGNPKGSNFAVDVTLIRKKNITKGDTNPNDEFDVSIEWDKYDKDYFDDLGKHIMEFAGEPTEEIPATAIEIIEAQDVQVGSSVNLSAKVIPQNATNKEILWSSSDESIAAVDSNGKVTGISVGTANITATLNKNNSIKATCKMTIKEAPANNEITISEARGKNIGDLAKVKGVVTFNDRNQTLYIQDSTGAIAISNNKSKIDLSSALKGKEISVEGTKDIFRNLVQLQATKIEVLGDKAIPEPRILSIKEVNTGKYQSQIIKIEKAILDVENKTLKQGEDTLSIYFIPSGINVKTADVVDTIAVVGVFDNTIQIYGSSATFTKIEEEDNIAPVIDHKAISEEGNESNLKVTAKVTDNRKIEKVTLYYRVKGEEQYKVIEMTEINGEYNAEISYTELDIKGMEYYIEAFDGKNKATHPENIQKPYYIIIKDIDTKGPEVFNLLPADGSSVGINKKPEIKAYYRDKSLINPLSIKLTLDGQDVTNLSTKDGQSITYKPVQDLEDGIHIAKLIVEDTKGHKTEKEWRFFVGKDSNNFYFGQLHAHTNISDGKGTLDEAYEWARDKGKADFIAITDHSNWFDNDKSANINDGSMSKSWVNAHDIADKYNEDGKFTAIYGYEMTWSGSTGGWGHINTFNTKGFETRSNNKMDLKNYYDTIAKQTQSISQLNHPGKTFGDFGDFGFYSKEADNVVNMIEVGNGEGPVRGSGYFPSYEYYTRALDKGWHLAPTNNQDNHKGNWITSNTARTVILANEKSRDGLYEAMREKKVYATEDENLKVNYTVNNMPMGSFLGNAEKLNFTVNVNDPDSTDVITKISIIANGGVEVQSKQFNSNVANWDLQLNPEYSYYYIKVEQKDKDIAVTAPVWVGENVAVGLSNVETDKSLAILGDEVTLTTGVYNNGQESLKNVKVEFFENKIEDKAKIGEKVVNLLEASKAESVSITWKPSKTGNFTVYARTIINLGETEKVFTQRTKVEIVNKEEVSKVVIDGAHQNQYVTGNYEKKVEAFKEMLKSNKSVVEINEKEITDEVLKDVKLLVLTDPQSTEDSKYGLKPFKYSDNEIEAIKRFVQNGGNIILTSKADYKDGKGEYSNGIQGNKVLEAIGTNLRINDDQVIDNTKNGGQAFRLAFDKFQSPLYNLTHGIPEGQTYSFYSGCSVILKDGGNAQKVDFLVKGHETTESSDADNDGDNIPVKKGELYVLGAEELSNGAKVVVGGSTFFSDFELSGDDLNANKKISENILAWMVPEKQPETISIKEFRKDDNKDGIPDNLGKRFTIEGIVTAQSEAVLPKNSFFEVVYIQDETGGITVFGVSKTAVKIGQKIRVTGIVDQYDGDTEIQIKDETKDLQILNTNVNPIEPKFMSTKDSMLEENEGFLVKIQGKVIKMDEQNLYIDDGTGISRAYVEGYIWDGVDASKKGKWDSSIDVGDIVSIVGLASEDAQGHRLRVRNTSEIVLDMKIVPLERVELNETMKELFEGESFNLEAKMLPTNATVDNIKWKSSDEKVAMVDENGKVTAIKEGKAIITVEANGREMANCQVTVKKKADNNSGNDNGNTSNNNSNNNSKNDNSNSNNETLAKTGISNEFMLLVVSGLLLMALGTLMFLKKRKNING